MEEWRLIDLGDAEPLIAQTFYEAIAYAIDRGLAPNTIIFVRPASPYVCIGYHQELEREVDVEYCRERGLPIIRRSQGGGAVYLDGNQLFYQIIGSERSEVIPFGVKELFERLLQPIVYIYRRLGVPAEFKPVNDIVVRGRKISGNGAGKIGSSTVLVGNIILDLDYESMARVLKVPSEKFRDKMAQSMREWVTSLKKELGGVPPLEQIKEILVEAFEKNLGVKLVKGGATSEEMEIWEKEVKPRHLSYEWLYQPESRHQSLRAVKVKGGVNVVEVDYKAQKLIRITLEVVEGRIRDVLISGDFFMIPEEALPKLEEMLKGATLQREVLTKKIQEFYSRYRVQTPNVAPEDFVEALMKAASELL
ncbi:MAG: lipoate--protein ligase family protein [Thaumarchaeota archaeon]|nr:lipoate--protein ligase family protein [Nitrososphaerota archaeon]